MTCRLVCLCVRRAAPVCGESASNGMRPGPAAGCQREMPRTDIEGGVRRSRHRERTPSGRVTRTELGAGTPE